MHTKKHHTLRSNKQRDFCKVGKPILPNASNYWLAIEITFWHLEQRIEISLYKVFLGRKDILAFGTEN